jgi:hypothetical protein
MALACAMGNGGDGPVAEWRRRESGATLFILVQIQAGSPAFARFASYGSASQPRQIQWRIPSHSFSRQKAALPRRSAKREDRKITVDGPLLGVTSLRNLV